jgi:hypothetical protein
METVQSPVPWLVDARTCCWVGKEGCQHTEETVWLWAIIPMAESIRSQIFHVLSCAELYCTIFLLWSGCKRYFWFMHLNESARFVFIVFPFLDVRALPGKFKFFCCCWVFWVYAFSIFQELEQCWFFFAAVKQYVCIDRMTNAAFVTCKKWMCPELHWRCLLQYSPYAQSLFLILDGPRCQIVMCGSHLHISPCISSCNDYFLTVWNRFLPEKLTGFQVVKKFLAFYGTRRLSTTFTSAHRLSLSLASSI